MKTKTKPMAGTEHAPGDLTHTHIEWHPNGSATVRHSHMPNPVKFGTGMSSFGGPSSQDQAYGTRHEALHNVAQHAGVESEMVDSPEPDDEADEANATALAGVGDLGSEKLKTKPKVFRDQSPNVRG